MTEIKNPFSPSFARVPEIFIDREDLVKETGERILQNDPMYQTTLIYGARGSPGLTKKGYNTLVTLDDVVVNDDCELLKFAAFYRRLATKKIAISTLLAATTDVTSAICTDKLLTVLLAPQIVKLPLNELQVHVTYHDVFKKGKRLMTGGACSEAARYVSYFGYTFQVVGYLLWENTAEGDKIPVAKVREIKNKILNQLSKTVFPEIYNMFSEEEKLFLKVMNEESWYDRTKISSVIRVLKLFGIDKYRVERIKSTLTKERIIYEVDSEVLAFDSPLFREFVKNQMD